MFLYARKGVRSEIRSYRICSRTETYRSLKMVLGIQIFRVDLGLFALVSVLCDWEWLGLETIMRQHYDVEHSIEPPKITNEATRHRLGMTEKLLKTILNPNNTHLPKPTCFTGLALFYFMSQSHRLVNIYMV